MDGLKGVSGDVKNVDFPLKHTSGIRDSSGSPDSPLTTSFVKKESFKPNLKSAKSVSVSKLRADLPFYF